MRKICRILRRLSCDQFDRVLSKLLQIVDHTVRSQRRLKLIVEKLLRFVLGAPSVSKQVAKILFHFFDYLPRLILTQQYQQHLWDKDDVDIAKTFRQILVVTIERMFKKIAADLKALCEPEGAAQSAKDGPSSLHHLQNSKNIKSIKSIKIPEKSDDGHHGESGKNELNPMPIQNGESLEPQRVQKKNELIAMVEVIANLFNLGLVHVRLVRKGLLDFLLPPHQGGFRQFQLIQVRALCAMLRTCGRKLDRLFQRRFVCKYLDKIQKSFGSLASDEDKVMAVFCLKELMELRRNNWVHHHLQEKPLNDIMEGTAEYMSMPMVAEEEDPLTPQSLKERESAQFPEMTPTPSLSSGSTSPAPFNNAQRHTVIACYEWDAATKTMVALRRSGNVQAVESGLDGSSFLLDTEGALSVAGNNKDGHLGVDSEIILKVLAEWHSVIFEMHDISSLIVQFVDCIQFARDWLPSTEAIRIEHDLTDAVKWMSKGVASRHRFVMTSGGKLYAAGCNLYNQLHCTSPESMYALQQEDPMQCRRRWVHIPYFADHGISLRAIACGYSSTAFLSAEGKVYAVGYSSFGNLGFGDKHHEMHRAMHCYRMRTVVKHIACGFDHTLALNEYGFVYSFGDNEFGQLGQNRQHQDRKQCPKVIEYFQTNHVHAVRISCGAFHSAVLDCTGNVHLFGYNLEHQCHSSHEATTKIAIPHLNTALSRCGRTLQFKCGAFHNVAQVAAPSLFL